MTVAELRAWAAWQMERVQRFALRDPAPLQDSRWGRTVDLRDSYRVGQKVAITYGVDDWDSTRPRDYTIYVERSSVIPDIRLIPYQRYASFTMSVLYGSGGTHIQEDILLQRSSRVSPFQRHVMHVVSSMPPRVSVECTFVPSVGGDSVLPQTDPFTVAVAPGRPAEEVIQSQATAFEINGQSSEFPTYLFLTDVPWGAYELAFQCSALDVTSPGPNPVQDPQIVQILQSPVDPLSSAPADLTVVSNAFQAGGAAVVGPAPSDGRNAYVPYVNLWGQRKVYAMAQWSGSFPGVTYIPQGGFTFRCVR